MLVLESSRLAGRGRLTQTAAAVALLAFAVALALLGRGPFPLGLAFVLGLFALAALYVQLVRRPAGVGGAD
jgi:apolipoprotein N-acyltransferase